MIFIVENCDKSRPRGPMDKSIRPVVYASFALSVAEKGIPGKEAFSNAPKEVVRDEK